MRRDKAVLDDKGVLRRGPRGARACGSKFTLSSPPKRKPAGPHFQRTGPEGFETVAYHQLVEIDAAAAGCPQHHMDSPAAWSSLAALQTAWPGCSVDHRNRTAYRDAFKRNLCHTWKRMSSQTPVIRCDPGSPAVMQGR